MSVAAPPSPAPGHSAAASRSSSLAGGASALLAAKIVFVIAGYAIYVGLSRSLTPAQFGIFLVVNSTVGVLNAIFVSGSIQTVSRFVSQNPEGAAATLRQALWLRLALAGTASVAYFLAAPLLASLLNDPTLVNYLRVSAIIPLAYAFYAALIGHANGMRRFVQQAAFDMTYSASKVAFVVGAALLGLGAFGAVSGFAAASVAIFLVAAVVIGRHTFRDRDAVGTPAGTMLRYEAAVMAHVGLTNLLMQLDLLIVQSLSGGEGTVPAAMYGSAVKLAQIPYSVLVALNFLIFPYIARSTAQAPTRETGQFVRHALRLGLALSVGPAIVLASLGPQTISFVFGPAYADASPALQWLAGGYVAFSLFNLSTTVINGMGRPIVSMVIAAVTIAVQATLARMLVPVDGYTGAAIASTVAYLLGLGLAIGYVMRVFGSVMPWASLLRVSLAMVVVMAGAWLVGPRLPVIVLAPALGVLYLVALMLLREWKAEEVRFALGRAPAAG